MKPTLQKLLRDQTAVTVVEYGLLMAFIFIAIMFSVRSVASETEAMWNSIAEKTRAAFGRD